MMDANAILDRLIALGITVRAEAGKVLIQPGSKAPQNLKDAIRANKAEIIALVTDPPNVELLLDRLRKGQSWLLNQHELWRLDDTTAADDAEFSRVWNSWWRLDTKLRTSNGFQGCIYGTGGACPEGFPCRGCSETPVPGVVAQLELIGRVS
jgi:hypothetical protein